MLAEYCHLVAIHNKNGKGLLQVYIQVIQKVIYFVAIHNKNGKGLLLILCKKQKKTNYTVAIHNKNGKGLLQRVTWLSILSDKVSQSTIKMEKGYYLSLPIFCYSIFMSQSTIKMEKGYYFCFLQENNLILLTVAIHNKNGKGLLRSSRLAEANKEEVTVAIHNKNGKGLLQ